MFEYKILWNKCIINFCRIVTAYENPIICYLTLASTAVSNKINTIFSGISN